MKRPNASAALVTVLLLALPGGAALAQRIILQPVPVYSESMREGETRKVYTPANFAGLFSAPDLDASCERITLEMRAPAEPPKEALCSLLELGADRVDEAVRALPMGTIPARGIQYRTLSHEIPFRIAAVPGVHIENPGCADDCCKILPLFGRPHMVVGGVADRTAPVVYEMACDGCIAIPKRGTWGLPDGYSLTVRSIDREFGRADIELRHARVTLARWRVEVTGDAMSRVIVWRRDAAGRSGVVWFVAHVAGIGEHKRKPYVRLTHVWLCGYEVTRHRIGDTHGRLTIHKISQNGIILHNAAETPVTYGSRTRLAGEFWLLAGASPPFRLTLARLVAPEARLVADSAVTLADAPARERLLGLLDPLPGIDIGAAVDLARSGAGFVEQSLASTQEEGP